MDVNGIRDSLLVENSRPSPSFRLAQAIRSLPVRMRVRKSICGGIHLPLTYPLPDRVDRTLQNWVGLYAYDLLGLVNVDLQVFSPREQLNLVGYVEQGGALLVCGGGVALGGAQGTYALLERVLPVRVVRGAGVRTESPIRTTDALAAGGAFGEPAGGAHLMPVELKPDAEVWIEADGQPVLVVGTCGKGRVGMWTGYPSKDSLDEEPFFSSNVYEDIARELILWLMDVPERARIVEYVPPPAEVSSGSPLQVSARAETEGGQWRLTLARDGREICNSDAPADGLATLAVETPADLRWDEPVDYRLDLVDAGGEVRARRAGTARGRPPGGLVIELLHDISVFETGSEIAFRVEGHGGLHEGRVEALLVEENGSVAAELGSAELAGDPPAAELSARLPELALGCYHVKTSAGEAEGLRLIAVVAPLERDEFFLTMAYGPGSHSDPEQAYERYQEYLSRNFTGGAGDSAEFLRRRGCDPAALSQASFGGGRFNPVKHGSLNLKDPYAIEPKQLTEPCVYSPEFEEAVKSQVAPEVDRVRRIARLYSVEFTSEPSLAPLNLCRCAQCLEAFRKDYGYEMPDYAEVARVADHRKWDLFDWMGRYVERGWQVMRKAIRDAGGHFPLNLTMAPAGVGQFVTEHGCWDIFRWSALCDMWDHDNYPRMYPFGRCTDKLPMNEFHYAWGYYRTIAQHRNQDLGYWGDGTDRDHPDRVIDKRASRETFLGALAQGAQYTRYFCHGGGTGQGAREERWKDYGDILGRVRPVLPLLKHSRRPPSQVAQVHPETHWIMNPERTPYPPGYEGWGFWKAMDQKPESRWYPYAWSGYNVSEMIMRAWGDCDVIHEKLLGTEFIGNYKALALCGTRWLPDGLAERLVEFVRGGGLLLCDNVPTLNERGAESDVAKPLIVSGDETWIVDDFAYALGSVGEGRVVRFNQDLNEFYSSAVDRGDVEARRRIKAAVAGLLSAHDLSPLATTSDPEVEVGLRLGQNYALAIAVNHSDGDRRIVAGLPSLPFSATWAVDALESSRLPIGERNGAPALELDVPPMDGRIVALYPEEPQALVVEAPSQVRRGDELRYEVRVLGAAGRPARGRHAVHVTVRDAAGRERTRYGGARATLDGVLSRNVPMAVNEAPGRWSVEVRDPLGRRVARRTFEVA